MSSEATHYVRRHVRGLTLVERAVLLTIADRCRRDGTTPRGRGPSRQTLATELEVCVRTVDEHVATLVGKKVLGVPGRCTFEIPGVDEHDPMVCGHKDCRAVAEQQRQADRQASERNLQDPAGKHRSSSSLSCSILPRNLQDSADKTLFPSERETARADADSVRTERGSSRPVVAEHLFVDDGTGTCTECPLPSSNRIHRTAGAA